MVDNDKRMIEDEVDGVFIRIKYFVADRRAGRFWVSIAYARFWDVKCEAKW